jgi:hypothetical protein
VVKPFLRPTDRATVPPLGWTAEPAGVWAGREVDVVYDPRRHTVVVLRDQQLSAPNAAAFRELGYQRFGGDGQNELWVRDRVAAASGALDRADQRLGAERSTGVDFGVGGRGL